MRPTILEAEFVTIPVVPAIQGHVHGQKSEVAHRLPDPGAQLVVASLSFRQSCQSKCSKKRDEDLSSFPCRLCHRLKPSQRRSCRPQPSELPLHQRWRSSESACRESSPQCGCGYESTASSRNRDMQPRLLSAHHSRHYKTSAPPHTATDCLFCHHQVTALFCISSMRAACIHSPASVRPSTRQTVQSKASSSEDEAMRLQELYCSA